MKRKLLFTILAVFVLMSALSLSAFAQKKSVSFSVMPSVNNGVAFSAPNPKDDNEQRAYIYTQNHNLIDDDLFWYNVRNYPSDAATSYSGWIRVTPENCARIVQDYYSSTYAPAGYSLYYTAGVSEI